MNRSNLAKFEIQLSALWRLWSQSRRYFKLVLMTNPLHILKLLQIAKLFLSSRQFWASNNPKYLSRALSAYFSLRSEWLKASNNDRNTGLEISGWASREALIQMKEALSGYRIRKVFRPDVWYFRGCQGGFFAGFTFEISISDFPHVIKVLEKSVMGFQKQMPTTVKDQFVGSPSSRLESINPLQRQRGLNWFSTHSVSPREFTWLVEIAADKEVAGLAINFFRQFEGYGFEGEILRCIAKYCLVIDEVPSGIDMQGWQLTNITKPAWIDLDKTGNQQSGMKSAKTNPKYFQAADVRITNGGLVQDAKGFVNWDLAQFPALDFVAGNYDAVIGSPSNLAKCFVRESEAGEVIDTGIMLSSRADSNWFHFLIETLPRILWIDSLVPPDVPVLVSNRVPLTGIQALQLVTQRSVKAIDPSKSTLVRRAFVPGPTVYHPDTQFLWNREDQIEINLEVVRALRTKVFEALGITETPPTESTFWMRAGEQRVVLNSRAVVTFLEGLGFTKSNPADLDFVDQVRSIFLSRHLVTSGGAAMSNFIFANSQATILVFVSKLGLSYPVPKFLTQVSGARLVLIDGRNRILTFLSTVVEKSHTSFRIKIRKLKKALFSEPPPSGLN